MEAGVTLRAFCEMRVFAANAVKYLVVICTRLFRGNVQNSDTRPADWWRERESLLGRLCIISVNSRRRLLSIPNLIEHQPVFAQLIEDASGR